MLSAPTTDSSGGLLDSAGRQILQFAEYRVIGLTILLFLAIFLTWRRYKFGAWPSIEESFSAVTTALGIVGAVTVGVVFLFTKPPAIELLSSQALLIIGISVPVLSFGYAFPRLRVLFLPPPSGPPPAQPEERQQLDF